MKKALALILSIAMVMAMIVGCGKEEPAADDAQQKEETNDASADSSEPAAPEINQKIAILFNSTITDGGFNEGLFKHINDLQAQYGFELSYQENVDDTAVNDVLRNYASDGYGLIIDVEEYHCEQILEIAPEFPDVMFGCINGYVCCAPNFQSISSDMWQHVYLGGVMAGKVTKSNKIGLITFSEDSDSALTMKAAFEGGAQQVNPDCVCIHVATGSFSDIAAGKEQAAALVAQGCDVILCNSGDCNPAVIEYCIEQKVYSVSAITDRNDMDETYVLGSSVTDNDKMLEMILLPYLNGEFKGSDTPYVGCLADGIEVFKINESVKDDFDQEVFDAMDDVAAKIARGEIKNAYLEDKEGYKAGLKK